MQLVARQPSVHRWLNKRTHLRNFVDGRFVHQEVLGLILAEILARRRNVGGTMELVGDSGFFIYMLNSQVTDLMVVHM